MNKQIRQLAILLLDTQNGINEETFEQLAAILIESENQDILNDIQSKNGFYWIDEDVAEKLKAV